MSLAIELGPGEKLYVVGGSIQVSERTGLAIHGRFPCLRARLYMPAAGAETPLALLYVEVQTAYIGNTEEQRATAMARLDDRFLVATQDSRWYRHALLGSAADAVTAGNLFRALQILKNLLSA